MSTSTVGLLCIALTLSFNSDPVNALAACGQSYFQPQLEYRNRIINGATAVQHSWPWTVYIVHRVGNMASTCGGSLLGVAATPGQSDVVLTAAHCVMNQQNTPLDPSGFTVYIGNHDVMQQEIAEVQVGVKNFIYHGQYQPYTNDVALLKLARPVKFNNYIQPVCLPSGGQQPSNPNNCYASGWGRIYNENDQSARVLQQARLPIIPDSTCNQWGVWGGSFDPNTMLCAGYMDGSKNVCNGDSGGPLVCPENNQWVLFGSVSFGNVGACAYQYKPGVFARISNLRPWIDYNVDQIRNL